jgi:hypothetical protein
MQADQDIAYRLAYMAANLELAVIQGALEKLQQEKERIENALAAISLPTFPQRTN